MKELILIIFMFLFSSCNHKLNNSELQNNWYSRKPYEKIICELSKPGVIISEIRFNDITYNVSTQNFIDSVYLDTLDKPLYDNGSKYYYLVRFEFIDNSYDLKKMYKIEQIISSCINVTPSGNGDLLWKTPLYDVYMWHNNYYMNLLIYEK